MVINDIVYSMNPYTYTISFRAYHPSLDLSGFYQSLSKIDGFIPTRIWKIGDDRKDLKGNQLQGKYEQSYCYFACSKDWQKSDDMSIENALEEILNQLKSCNKLLKTVSAEGRLVFFIGLSAEKNVGLQLDKNLLRRLAEFEIGLDFDIYSL